MANRDLTVEAIKLVSFFFYLDKCQFTYDTYGLGGKVRLRSYKFLWPRILLTFKYDGKNINGTLCRNTLLGFMPMNENYILVFKVCS